jgi:hypothetical protein
MKIKIEAVDQKEFDHKRTALIKKIAGNKLDVKIEEKGRSKAGESRPPFYQAQKEMLDHWNEEFQQVLTDIKEEIANVIKG